MSDWIILKFGGSSVGDPKHWNTIANQVEKQLLKKRRPVLVLSALKNVSNLLEALLHQSLAGVYENAINQLQSLHLGFASDLGLSINQQITGLFTELSAHCLHIHQAKRISAQSHAQVLAYGELLSTTIGNYYLNQLGIKSQWVDARNLLTSQTQEDNWHHFTSTQCDYEPNIATQEALLKYNSVIVTQGFIAADKQQRTVLLGREGSDTSAAYLGAKLNAQKIEIWTDVAGIFSSNPKEINNTQPISQLSYQQAQLMTKLGAKVLHPRAVKPAEKFHIPIKIKSTIKPKQAGTIISNTSSDRAIVGISFESNLLQISADQTQTDLLTRIQEPLEQFGYDLIEVFNSSTAKQQSMSYWQYRNSDKPEPTNDKLHEAIGFLATDNATIVNQLALISVIGKAQMVLCEIKKSDSSQLIKKEYISSEKASFCVAKEDCLRVAQAIHDIIF